MRNPMLGISSGTLAGILRDRGIANYAAYETVDSFQYKLIQHAERVKLEDWREVIDDFFKGGTKMERKQIQVSTTAIDDAIWEFEQAILKAFPAWQTESEFSRAEYDQRAMLSAVQYYIYTARASTEFLRAFINLSNARMLTLARRCWASEDKSTKGIADTVKRYLRME